MSADSGRAVGRIRPLVHADCPAVRVLLRATENFNEAELRLADELMDSFLDRPGQEDYFAFVAEAPGPAGPDVVGFLVVGPTAAPVGTWDLYWIAVAPSHQGRGIGQALDTCAEVFVRARWGYLILAETSGRPRYARSRAFYRKQGYEAVARIADYYGPADDLIIFAKRWSNPIA